MSTFVLASGDYLVISPAGIRTVVTKTPYALTGGVSLVRTLRTIADAVEAAEKATVPLYRSGVCASV